MAETSAVKRFLGPGTPGRTGLFISIGTVLILVLTQLIYPGAGANANGTPPAILFNGLVLGLLNGLVAVGIILIYRMQRIINFSQGAMGIVGGIFAYHIALVWKWNFWPAVLAGIAVSGAVGAIIELGFVKRFFNAPRLVLTVLTIALAELIAGSGGRLVGSGIFGDPQDWDPEVLDRTGSIPIPFPDFQFQIGSFPLKFDFSHLFALGAGVLAVVGLGLFLKFSRAGVAVRAAAENAERARLLGISIGGLSTLVWILAGTLSGVGAVSSAVVSRSFAGGGGAPELLVVALVSAVLARMQSFTLAVASAVGITVVQEATRHSYDANLDLVQVGLFVLVLVGLLLQRKGITRSESGAEDASSWKAAEEYRGVPKEMLEVPSIRYYRPILLGVAVIGVLLVSLIADTRQIEELGRFAIVAIALLSLVVLTGWGGQVSLGQWALVAVGAILGGAMTFKLDIHFFLALAIVPVITAGVAMLIGFPALRIKGLFLGIVTFTLAFPAASALFNEKYFGWLLPERVERPAFFIFDFQEGRSMLFLAVGGLVLAIALVVALRRSRPGRVLIGVRDNEPNIQSFGINAVRTRLMAFAVAGFLCGFAGVLFAHHQRSVSEALFPADLSLQLFLYAAVGGVGSIAGALLGAGYYGAVEIFGESNALIGFLFGNVGVVLILYFFPGGLASIVFGIRDGVLKIIAQRRQMVVPSLFADLDPEAMKRRLIPLSEPIPNAGLAALPYEQRYKAASELYAERGREKRKKEETVEKVALGAAAERAGSDEES